MDKAIRHELIELETPHGFGAIDPRRVEIISEPVEYKPRFAKGPMPEPASPPVRGRGRAGAPKAVLGRWLTMQSGQKLFVLWTEGNKKLFASAFNMVR